MPDLTSGVITSTEFDSSPNALLVSWIAWDSGFADSGLRVGDRITMIDSKQVAPSKNISQLFGQYAEAQSFIASGAKPNTVVALTIRRRAEGQGWATVTCKGTLKPATSFRTKDNQPSLSPNGPTEMEHDNFNEGWFEWYTKKFTRICQSVLEGGWAQISFNNRFELQQLLEQKPRVDYLVAHYPGLFAKSVAMLWSVVRDSLQGPAYKLTPADLTFRRSEDEVAAKATAISGKAWDDFTKANAALIMTSFPAPDPLSVARGTAVGKLLVLPAIRPVDWLEQGGKTYFAFGSTEDGYYFADAETDSAQSMLLALQRFRRLVTPSVDESYQMVGRVLDSVSLRMVGQRAYYGVEIEIVAALVGGAMFVDVSKRKGTAAPFAGEDIFDMPMHALPPDIASPKEIMEAFFGALKTGDLKLWTQLFADWSVGYLEDGRPLIYPHDIRIDQNMWEDSRRNLLKQIYDLRVAWVDDIHSVTTGKEFPNAPHIEQVAVEIDVIGSFDGEYRKFAGVSVMRFWQLQRIDGGPWRISSIQRL